MPRQLSIKQRLFTQKYIQYNGNGTQAALDAYDTQSPAVAHSIAAENLRKPTIREALEEALCPQGLTLSQITENLGELANTRPVKVSADTVLRANVELLKLHGAYPDKKSYQYTYSAKQNISALPFNDLKQELEKIDGEIKELIENGGIHPK